MIEPLLTAASVLCLLVAMAIHPTRARCPDGFYVEGVRSWGGFTCHRQPVGDPNLDGTYGRPDVSVEPGGELAGRLYCTGGAVPIVVDSRTVGCQR